MNDKLLTIVVPTYNMERLLPKCLSSLIIEDKEIFNLLEVLIVIDGATDSSSDIGHTYQDKYPEVFRVIDKENGNYGSCVNRGLTESRGKYIKILDADDQFDNEVLKMVLSTVKDIDADMVLTNYTTIDEMGNALGEHNFMLPVGTVLSANVLTSDIGAHMAMHAVMYKAENLKRIGYKQTEGISYTDQEWIYEPMTTVKTLYYINEPLYLYLVGREGQTMNLSALKKNMCQNLTVLASMLKIYEKTSTNDTIFQYLKGRIECFAESIYNRYLLNAKEFNLDELVDFDKVLKKISQKLYKFTGNLKAGKLPFVKLWRLFYYTNDYGVNRFFAERKYRFGIGIK